MMTFRLIFVLFSFIVFGTECKLFHVYTIQNNCKSNKWIDLDSVIPDISVVDKVSYFIDSVHSIDNWRYGPSKSKYNSTLQWNIYCTIFETEKNSFNIQLNYSVGSYRLFSDDIEWMLPSYKVHGYFRVKDINIFVVYFENDMDVAAEKVEAIFPKSGFSSVNVEIVVDCETNSIVNYISKDYISRYYLRYNN